MVLWNTPNLTQVLRGSRAPGPDVASALYFTCRFMVYGLVVICDQMGVSVLGLGAQTLFDHALRMDSLSTRVDA